MAHKLSVAFILAPNFTLLAFSSFIDTLRLAADEEDRSRPIQCRWAVVSHDMRPVRSSCGVEVVPTSELRGPDHFDYVVVVGGVLGGPSLAFELVKYLQELAGQGQALAGICTGSFILAQLGLMEQRRCCVSWFHVADFQIRFPHVLASSEELYIIDRDRLTCAGGTSVIHLASHLVERHCGKRHAVKALRIMIEEGRDSAQAIQPQPYATAPMADNRVKRALLLMERMIETPVSLGFIASHVGMSVRQLERLFKQECGITPSAAYVRMRLAHSLTLLRSSRAPVSEIALRCGYVNRSHFAQNFRQAFGESPSQVRHAASGQLAGAIEAYF